MGLVLVPLFWDWHIFAQVEFTPGSDNRCHQAISYQCDDWDQEDITTQEEKQEGSELCTRLHTNTGLDEQHIEYAIINGVPHKCTP